MPEKEVKFKVNIADKAKGKDEEAQ